MLRSQVLRVCNSEKAIRVVHGSKVGLRSLKRRLEKRKNKRNMRRPWGGGDGVVFIGHSHASATCEVFLKKSIVRRHSCYLNRLEVYVVIS